MCFSYSKGLLSGNFPFLSLPSPSEGVDPGVFRADIQGTAALLSCSGPHMLELPNMLYAWASSEPLGGATPASHRSCTEGWSGREGRGKGRWRGGRGRGREEQAEHRQKNNKQLCTVKHDENLHITNR